MVPGWWFGGWGSLEMVSSPSFLVFSLGAPRPGGRVVGVVGGFFFLLLWWCLFLFLFGVGGGGGGC